MVSVAYRLSLDETFLSRSVIENSGTRNYLIPLRREAVIFGSEFHRERYSVLTRAIKNYS